MKRGLRWRVLTLVGSVLFAAMFLLPNVVGEMPAWWTNVFSERGINLGLDLQGGIHLVLEVETDKAVENRIDLILQQLRSETREKGIAARNWKKIGRDGLSFELVSQSRRGELDDLMSSNYSLLQPVGESGRTLRYKLLAPEIKNIKQLAVEQALETIRNRVDEFGVSEPTIQRSGTDGILIQLPGVENPKRAKALIGRTAQLQFQLVADDPSTPGTIKVPGISSDPVTGRRSNTTYTLEPTVLMTGEVISDARHRPGQYGEPPYVTVTFDSAGSRRFDQLTGANVGRRLAIVLDGKVQSAPVIQERIAGGQARITGNFTLDEARDLAIVLRAGALPAPVKIAEERTVGPSLGHDSIRNGTKSFIIGGLLVLMFMPFYYRFSGLIADVSLVLNVFLLLGILAAFNATLTLPGIAGIVLTLGMAVDANVLINERVREELRSGQTSIESLDAGYRRALPAILDSNATTFLAGIILFQFGSGPIKGFALTLCVGILTSVFTAVFASRVLHDTTITNVHTHKLSI